jgi:hypothetical protein
MESKPTVEQFMGDFFRERTEAVKKELEVHQVFQRRFYHDEFFWGNRGKSVGESEAEEIVDVAPSDIGADVISTGSTIYPSRYRLMLSGQNWLIREVDMGCSLCHINGVAAGCVICGGRGWLSLKDIARLVEQQLTARTARLIREEEFGGRGYHDPAIEQFMTEHFRERSTVLKKQVDIQIAFLGRFYSPECDWRWGEGNVQMSESERIVEITPVKEGARVITLNSRRFLNCHRYHLRPTDKSWLIREVNTRCHVCNDNGKSNDCHLCSGTGWANGSGFARRSRSDPPCEEPPPDHPRWKLE